MILVGHTRYATMVDRGKTVGTVELLRENLLWRLQSLLESTPLRHLGKNVSMRRSGGRYIARNCSMIQKRACSSVSCDIQPESSIQATRIRVVTGCLFSKVP